MSLLGAIVKGIDLVQAAGCVLVVLVTAYLIWRDHKR